MRHQLFQKPSAGIVGKMSFFAQYAHFQRIWITADLQHIDIVICLQKHAVAILQMGDRIIRDAFGADGLVVKRGKKKFLKIVIK